MRQPFDRLPFDRLRVVSLSNHEDECSQGHFSQPFLIYVRFHFLDSNWSAGVFIKGRDDTRALDPQQLDRLDYFVAELKKRGIYTNLNLNVGRNYRKADAVKDYEYLGLAKVATNRRL